jgi:hypothetical protein
MGLTPFRVADLMYCCLKMGCWSASYFKIVHHREYLCLFDFGAKGLVHHHLVSAKKDNRFSLSQALR